MQRYAFDQAAIRQCRKCLLVSGRDSVDNPFFHIAVSLIGYPCSKPGDLDAGETSVFIEIFFGTFQQT